MKVAFFSTQSYDRQFFSEAKKIDGISLRFFELHLTSETAPLAAGYEAVCVFVNDRLDAQVINQLCEGGTRLIALRCAGFNNVDLEAAEKKGLTVARVPSYSPHGVAEHCVALMLALNRKIYRAHNRIREGNFLLEGLLGFEFFNKTVGVVGTGQIGIHLIRIMRGFGCRVLAFDVHKNKEAEKLGADYVGLDALLKESDVISLHVPLLPETHHMINKESIQQMKPGVMIINTSRGGLIDTKAVIRALKSGKIGYLGLDVYEEEGDLFFEDLSDKGIQDDVFARLLTFPNVMVTGHQAFFTENALRNIAATTLENVREFKENGTVSRVNKVTTELVRNR